MFGVLKLTGLIHNQPNFDYRKWPRPTEILDAATKGGAAALGMGAELGEIAPGYLADLTLLNLENAAFLPLRDPYLHLVYCENGYSVDTVIVHGKVVVERGAIVTIDEMALRREIREYCHPTGPGFPLPESATNTHEVLATIDTLRELILSKERS